MPMPRVPTVVNAVLVPDGSDLWIELARAAANQQDVCLTAHQVRKLLADVKAMEKNVDLQMPPGWKS